MLTVCCCWKNEWILCQFLNIKSKRGKAKNKFFSRLRILQNFSVQLESACSKKCFLIMFKKIPLTMVKRSRNIIWRNFLEKDSHYSGNTRPHRWFIHPRCCNLGADFHVIYSKYIREKLQTVMLMYSWLSRNFASARISKFRDFLEMTKKMFIRTFLS